MTSTSWLLAAVAQQGILDRPVDQTVHGHRIDWLMDFSTFWIFALFALMALWLFAAVFLHRDGKHKAVYEPGDKPKDWVVALGIAGFVFVVVDGTLFTKSFVDVGQVFWNFKGVEEDPKTLRLEINARQWVWEGRYAGEDGKFNTADDIVRLNDLRVPVGRPVLMQVAAADVLHNLYIPQLRIKTDAVPGSITQAWFEAKNPGIYEIACAQHCGINHYKMRAMMTVMPEAEFEQWLELAQRDAKSLYSEEDAEAHWGWTWNKR